MNNTVELYVNNTLVDLPNDFSISLKRVFYNPTQIQTKDSQRSYDIMLPVTDTNKRLFRYINLPEVGGKFKDIYKATLIINDVTVFDASLIIREIEPGYFLGNLAKVFKMSLKEVLDDKFMNQCGEWIIPFGRFNESVEMYNTKENSECIFPLVMYGLFPKNPSSEGNYTAKNLYDDSVSLGIGSFMPSINCLQVLKKVFENNGLSITGDAFNDDRLTSLYMSYKNPSDKEVAWNYGQNIIQIDGTWSNCKRLSGDMSLSNEPTTLLNADPKEKDNTSVVYNTDLLSNINGIVNIRSDASGDVSSEVINGPSNNYPNAYTSNKIRVPATGYYKISLYAKFEYDDIGWNSYKRQKYGDKQLSFISPYFNTVNHGQEIEFISTIEQRRTEIKIIKDNNNNGFELENVDIDLAYYEKAIQQKPNTIEYPKYYPKGGEVCLIDPEQDENLICGLGFGKGYGDRYNAYSSQSNEDGTVKYTNPIAIKGGESYNNTSVDFVAAATQSSGYMEATLNENNEVVYTQSDNFKVDAIGSDTNYSKATDSLMGGSGSVETIVWLDAGTELTLVHSTDNNKNHFTGSSGATAQNVTFNLSIIPYKSSKEWLTQKLDNFGNTVSGEIVVFNENTDYETDKIDLIKFLPSNVKINDWINNLTSAFNLSLTQLTTDTYELSTNKYLPKGGRCIDLTDRSSAFNNMSFKPLSVPSVYNIGFTINEEEQGYIETKNKGGEKIKTWNETGTELSQTSSFSYSWYKDIDFDVSTIKDTLSIPIIADKEPFELDSPRDYKEMQSKHYSDLAQRFWYKGDLFTMPNVNNGTLTVCKVKNAIDESISLDYFDRQFSILRNYFMTMTNNETHYTEIQCYLKQEEYNRLHQSYVIFEGDLYYVSEASIYNPITEYARSLKLIRKSF